MDVEAGPTSRELGKLVSYYLSSIGDDFLFNLVLLDLGAFFCWICVCIIFCYAVFVINVRSLRRISSSFCSMGCNLRLLCFVLWFWSSC